MPKRIAKRLRQRKPKRTLATVARQFNQSARGIELKRAVERAAAAVDTAGIMKRRKKPSGTKEFIKWKKQTIKDLDAQIEVAKAKVKYYSTMLSYTEGKTDRFSSAMMDLKHRVRSQRNNLRELVQKKSELNY